jgi:cold shock CspA family protein
MATTRQQPEMGNRADGRAMGKVSALQKAKGFGFVTDSSTGKDYFFHKSECLGIWDSLEQYETVSFLPGMGPKGPRATEVERP